MEICDRRWSSAVGAPGATGSKLVAVLLNPPLSTTGVRTIRAVEHAGSVLGYDAVQIVNLFADATPTVAELNTVATSACLRARRLARQALQEASGLLGAWGVSGLTGDARLARDTQLRWLYEHAAGAGIRSIWMVGGEPRHPSRWHQYVSDRHGRTAGGDFEARLAQVLTLVPIDAGATTVLAHDVGDACVEA